MDTVSSNFALRPSTPASPQALPPGYSSRNPNPETRNPTPPSPSAPPFLQNEPISPIRKSPFENQNSPNPLSIQRPPRKTRGSTGGPPGGFRGVHGGPTGGFRGSAGGLTGCAPLPPPSSKSPRTARCRSQPLPVPRNLAQIQLPDGSNLAIGRPPFSGPAAAIASLAVPEWYRQSPPQPCPSARSPSTRSAPHPPPAAASPQPPPPPGTPLP